MEGQRGCDLRQVAVSPVSVGLKCIFPLVVLHMHITGTSGNEMRRSN